MCKDITFSSSVKKLRNYSRSMIDYFGFFNILRLLILIQSVTICLGFIAICRKSLFRFIPYKHL